ncbi:hypothetical protein [Thermohalobacter berrensis]|uniref:Uncharacterized protein n=1 Tax=Thermohalobacter berrensis TaxID=99594 RepID=A0A419SWA1_9FIRM|nr:hypothetical protein [Thermohalobacter berrensis]RKD29507.1 hypothetical protein BET03_05455 [Thermohalobacter berrensis]
MTDNIKKAIEAVVQNAEKLENAQGGQGAPVCDFDAPNEVQCLFNICKSLVLNFCVEKENDGPPSNC